MPQQIGWSLTRRQFFIGSCGLLIPSASRTVNVPRPAVAWPLHRSRRARPAETSGSGETVVAATGRLEWVSYGATEMLPRLDGYSVWFEQTLQSPVQFDRELSLSLWLALEAFPVDTSSIVEWSGQGHALSLAIDRLGFVLVTIQSGEHTLQAKGHSPLARGQWLHLALSLSADGELILYADRVELSRSRLAGEYLAIPQIEDVCMGRSRDCEVVAKIFPTGVLNGLLRDVRVYKECLSSGQVSELSREFQIAPAPLATDPGWFDTDTQRPRYHAMPPRAWTNEPHGLVHWRGEYHLFYQKNPDGPYWGHIHWGHMTSPDLLHWTERPIALAPEPGPDSEGCWSGSAIVFQDKLHLVYTGGDGTRSSICLASSEDGITFTKYAHNPIIEAPPASIGVKEFRDPFIWRDGNEFRMIIGSGIDGVGGTALLYRSDDLISWHYLKPLLIGDKGSSGVFWEMPVFIPIGTYHVLVVCEVPGRASYWVGRWINGEFSVLSAQPQRLDLFNHFLSPTPYIDRTGRAITIGIVPDARDSREAWQAGWAHLYGLPRELSLDGSGALQQRPLGRLQELFTELVPRRQPCQLTNEWHVCEDAGTCLRICASLEQGTSQAVAIAVRRAPKEQEVTLLRYEWETQRLTLDQTRSSLNPHALQRCQEVSYSPLHPGQIHCELFLDQSVFEVFLDSRTCFSTRLYPILPESTGIALRAEGGNAVVMSFTVAELDPRLSLASQSEVVP